LSKGNFTTISVNVSVFKVVLPLVSYVATNVSEANNSSIFRIEMTLFYPAV
jgi:hypothetical protein